MWYWKYLSTWSWSARMNVNAAKKRKEKSLNALFNGSLHDFCTSFNLLFTLKRGEQSGNNLISYKEIKIFILYLIFIYKFFLNNLINVHELDLWLEFYYFTNTFTGSFTLQIFVLRIVLCFNQKLDADEELYLFFYSVVIVKYNITMKKLK